MVLALEWGSARRVTSSIGMLEAGIFLCCVAAAMAGARAPPDGLKPVPCLKGQKCPPPMRRCPFGMASGPRCGPRFPPCKGLSCIREIPACKAGYTCIRGQCCRDPPQCPAGSLTGPTCSPFNMFKRCKYGYTCRLGRCCSNQCPRGQLKGPFCNKSRPCKRGYRCLKGVCCRRKIIVTPRCPLRQIQVKGLCHSKRGCPPGSYCYKGKICCRRHIIFPPQGKFCPGGAAPPKFPICRPMLSTKSRTCTSDKQCRKTEKCCQDYCGRRRCMTALSFPPM